jgi:hypothetical protein
MRLVRVLQILPVREVLVAYQVPGAYQVLVVLGDHLGALVAV